MELAADFNIIVSDSSPYKAALVASRSGGLVQTENKGAIQIRFHVVVKSNGSKKVIREHLRVEKLLSESA